ncbi:MAG TPA: class I SAM-dependent methyltransferase, partial [Pyrinomonadaceae bacterium]
MSADCCRVLEEKIGVRAINSSDTKGALAEAGPYDVIALWHVVEHLPDPLETLAAAAARLNPGGLLVVAAPNPSAFQFRVLGRYWTHVDAPRHVFLIPSELLVERVRSLGLKPLLVTTTDEGGVGWNRFGWEQSLFNLTERARPRHWLRRVGTKLTSMLDSVERQGMRGSAYTIVFQKES